MLYYSIISGRGRGKGTKETKEQFSFCLFSFILITTFPPKMQIQFSLLISTLYDLFLNKISFLEVHFQSNIYLLS
jgi:hypothetical protein